MICTKRHTIHAHHASASAHALMDQQQTTPLTSAVFNDGHPVAHERHEPVTVVWRRGLPCAAYDLQLGPVQALRTLRRFQRKGR
eukprot:scaffold118391_cov24-Tisochrysis_lutea.AAC.1